MYLFDVLAAKGDLSGVLANLEGHWNVLEAEVEELNKDIQRVDECLRKYGELFRLPFQHLKQLKREKKERMKDIIGQLETFNANLEAGRKLLKTLDKGNVSALRMSVM